MEVFLRDRAWVKGPTAPVLKGEGGVWYAEERMAGCGNRSCGEVAPALSVEGQFGLRAFLTANLIGNPKIQYMTNKAFLALIYGLMGVLSLQARELIPYRKGDKWGFCIPDKKVMIQSKYGDIGFFRESLALMGRNGQWVFIHQTGRDMVRPECYVI